MFVQASVGDRLFLFFFYISGWDCTLFPVRTIINFFGIAFLIVWTAFYFRLNRPECFRRAGELSQQ